MNRDAAAGWADQDMDSECVSDDEALAFFDERAGW